MVEVIVGIVGEWRLDIVGAYVEKEQALWSRVMGNSEDWTGIFILMQDGMESKWFGGSCQRGKALPQ